MKFIKENWFKITIILLIIIVGIFGYFGFKYYQKYQNEKVVKEKEAQALSDQQQQALQKAQTEIDNLKTQVDSSNKTAQDLKTQINSTNKITQDLIKQKNSTNSLDNSITTSDLASYLTGVVQVFCNGERGSGSLQKYEGSNSYLVVTNQHVIENPFSNGFCFITTSDLNERATGVYLIDTKEKEVWNNKTDVASMPLHPFTDPLFFSKDLMFLTQGFLDSSIAINKLNYEIGNLQSCSGKVPTGSNLIIIGYPSDTTTNTPGGGTENSRTVTNGIVSGYDTTSINLGLPYSNYFISAKIDAGNSGGIALSKENGNLCLLGIPTWVQVGTYDTQGIVQNINNVFYTK